MKLDIPNLNLSFLQRVLYLIVTSKELNEMLQILTTFLTTYMIQMLRQKIMAAELTVDMPLTK